VTRSTPTSINLWITAWLSSPTTSVTNARDRMKFGTAISYFGGLKNCQLNIEDDRRQYDKSELICPKCCPISFESDCKKHQKEYIEFKCKFCCSVALWFCWGTTHFCEPCHRKATEMSKKTAKDLTQCANAESCPLRIQHKPNGGIFLKLIH
jgi:hypothetical protein